MTGLDPGAAKRLLAELERVKGDPKRFKGYRDHPAEFARDVLGIGVFEVDGRGLWAKQVAILESIRDHRLTTVRSGHGIGKAVANETLLQTPDGLRLAGEVAVGDRVFGGDGLPATVLAVYPQGVVPLYRVTFTDGTWVRCCGDHLWTVTRHTSKSRDRVTLRTSDILAEGLSRPNGKARARLWSMPPSPVLSLPFRATDVDPYTLGAWLGDGCRGTGALTTGAEDVAHYRAQGFYGTVDHCLRGPGLCRYLRKTGLLFKYSYEKSVPGEFMENSAEVRLAVLQGLLDTDGTVGQGGGIEFCSTSRALAEDVAWLVRSLGGIANRINERTTFFTHLGKRRQGRPSYRFRLRLPDGVRPFRLARKMERTSSHQSRYGVKWIESIEPDGSGNAVCFTVDREDGLFLLSDGIVTHNTYTFAVAALWWLYARQGLVVTTASSWPQVRDVLWRQIHMLGADAKVHLPRLDGHPLQTEWAVTETWRAWGRSVDNPTSWQGIHHPDLLVLVDEAVGIKADIHRSLRSLATGGNNRFCYIANPTEYGGPFWESHQEGSGFNRIHVSCLDHPNIVHQKELIPGAVTQAWIDEQARESGEESPEYAARVLGEFPAEGTSAVFSQRVVDRAMEEDTYAQAREAVLANPREPVVFSLDVARYGSNKTVLVERRGDVIVQIDHWQGHDATVTQDRVKTLVGAARDAGSQVAALVVDEVGLGGPVMDNLRREMPWLNVLGFHSGRPAKDGVYNNRRSELWLRARRVFFDANRIRLPYHKQLRIDLLSPTYGFNSSSKLQVERKEQLERRGVDSSDFADAVLMSLVTDFRYDEPEAPPVGANRDPLAMEKLEPLEESQSPFEALPGWA